MNVATVLSLITALLFTTGLHIDNKTGRLKLDPGDLEALSEDLDPDKRGSKRGGKYQNNFKRLIPKEGDSAEVTIGDQTLTVTLDETIHHIISNEMVEGCTFESIRANNQRTSELLVEELINRPETKEVIERRLAGGQITGEEVGQLLHGAISWNPSNVVRGPNPIYRVEDPATRIDSEILRHQPEQYRHAVAEFKTALASPTVPPTCFEKFVNLPRPEPVQWSETQTPRKGLSPNTKKKLVVTGLKQQRVTPTQPDPTQSDPVQIRPPEGERSGLAWFLNLLLKNLFMIRKVTSHDELK